MLCPSPQPDAPEFLTREDRPKILYVVHHRDFSGAETMHLPLMRADVDPLLACAPGSRSEELARRSGVPTAALPFRSLRHSGGALETVLSVFRGVRSAYELRRLLRRHPERKLVYCIALRPGMLTALAKFGLDRRAVWFLSDFMPPAPLRFAARLLARLGCDRAIATSASVAADFVGRSAQLRARTTVVYPGTDVERFDSGLAKPGAPRAAVLGQVSPTKRTDLAVEIARRVAQELPAFQLEILGRAQYRPSDYALERQLHDRVAHDALLSRHVRFVGHVSDVAAELPRFGLLLHCRPDEPFGIALIEAMAAGLPVVAPDSAGPAEIVEHGVTGLLYPPGDSERAAAQVIQLVRHSKEAARMGAAAREAVQRRFTARRQLDEMQRILVAVSRFAPPACA